MVRIAHAPRWTLPAGVAVSLLVHVLFGVVVLSDLRPPDLDIELQLPAEVEFGLTEAVAAVPVPPTPPPPVETPASADTDEPSGPAVDGGTDGGMDAGVDGGDAGPDAGDAGQDAPTDASTDAGDGGDAALPDGAVGSKLPPGAQIAVRIDMERIRKSPIVEDVRKLLDAIPDWDALLEGSGIDPVSQLDRVLIATPNLQRSRLVVAGKYQGGREKVEQAVRQLAQAKGIKANWGSRQGVAVAPWANKDATPRVIALIGPQHFSITREEDLPRLLAVAAARRKADGGLVDAGEDALHPAEALLSMGDQEGMSLEVEGVRQFVRRGHGIPAKLRISAIETPETEVRLKGRWVYDDEVQAEQARVFWESARRAYARNTLVLLLGLGGPLNEGSIVREDNELHLSATLSVRQTRLILGYVREMVAPPPPLPPMPRPSGRGPAKRLGGP